MGIKVILIKPFGVADEIVPPMSLGLLATQIRKDHDVKIIDALKDKLDPNAIIQMVKEESVDIVGFQAWSKDVHEIKKICTGIKKAIPKIITTAGGIHPTMDPEGTLNFFGDCLDYAYQGEGEIGFKQFVDCVAWGDCSSESLGKIPGLVWRDDSVIKVNKNRFIEDLDSVG
ncbi:MAG TPA: cobalamin-dependent protein, partial [Candidatus Brocadiales bacterium]|nr:cobalamin-dependent protein [Candidatus Brocadiales bacterium]